MKTVWLDSFTAGVAYYPEHWEKNLWEKDLRRMQAAGITRVRIGDFAWSKYEYREGEFTIGYYDEFLDLCARTDMKVIFCTPTAAPPVWMSDRYPGILNTDGRGNHYDGPRRHYNYNSEVYRAFCVRLVSLLAEHYGRRGEIVAWQIDNELNCDLAEFHSEADQAAYRKYLRDKFHTLDELNDALGLTFWNRTISDWGQARLLGNNVGGAVNPQQTLEEKRFFSESAISFCALQANTIRPFLNEGVALTTNGLFDNLDYNRLLEEAGLDAICYDSYPNFAFDLNRPARANDLLDRNWSRNLAWTRSASRIFGIMEQQAGANGWSSRMETPAPKPGQMRLWALQSVAHGANMVAFFRWRTSPIGCEIYWHGLNDYANTPNRRMDELKRFTDDLCRLEPIAKAEYTAKAAVLRDYDNDWDAVGDVWHGRLAKASDAAWFAATQRTHTPCDLFYLRGGTTVDELRKYDLLVYPHAAIMDEWTSGILHQYVQNGGTLVFGARTGYKGRTGRCPARPMPGLIGEWCGVSVADYTYTDAAGDTPTVVVNDRAFSAPVFHEVLRPEAADVTVTGRFHGGYYDGTPALVTRKVGAGTVLYLGAGFSQEMATEILRIADAQSPYRVMITLPETMELAVRKTDMVDYLFVLNYAETDGKVMLHVPAKELLTGAACDGAFSLPGYGVAVFQVKRSLDTKLEYTQSVKQDALL